MSSLQHVWVFSGFVLYFVSRIREGKCLWANIPTIWFNAKTSFDINVFLIHILPMLYMHKLSLSLYLVKVHSLARFLMRSMSSAGTVWKNLNLCCFQPRINLLLKKWHFFYVAQKSSDVSARPPVINTSWLSVIYIFICHGRVEFQNKQRYLSTAGNTTPRPRRVAEVCNLTKRERTDLIYFVLTRLTMRRVIDSSFKSDSSLVCFFWNAVAHVK